MLFFRYCFVTPSYLMRPVIIYSLYYPLYYLDVYYIYIFFILVLVEGMQISPRDKNVPHGYMCTDLSLGDICIPFTHTFCSISLL